MKRNNKKGFTIVELVIVIAVIAILAAVLIPTFASVTAKAKDSKAMQEAKNEYTNYLAENPEFTGDLVIVMEDERVLIVNDGQFHSDVYESVEKALDALDTATTTAAQGAIVTGTHIYNVVHS
ncbi:MAG: type II secretion system protein [Clostridiales bacterium]|nr:type II secretion system protein [Clostridiales bacterium]